VRNVRGIEGVFLSGGNVSLKSIALQNMIIDLTKPLGKSFAPFSSGNYSDPPLTISKWCSVDEQGFNVSKLSLGTQTGTHIDAPAHFLKNGVTLEALAAGYCIGSYFLIDLTQDDLPACVEKRLRAYGRENILMLRTPEHSAIKIAREIAVKLLSLTPPLIVLSGEIEISDAPCFEFNRLVAHAGKFLAEDLDQKAARRLNGTGEIFVLPLHLLGVSGSPCRVLARL